jgi:hypothetical protein
MTPTEARLRMINNGFNITPLRDGKRPFLLSWQELATGGPGPRPRAVPRNASRMRSDLDVYS